MELVEVVFPELPLDCEILASILAVISLVGLQKACPVVAFLHAVASQVGPRVVRVVASQVVPLIFLVAAFLATFLEVRPS